VEQLEPRWVLATLGPIAPVSVGAGVGFQLPLDGGNGGPQTYTVTSSNPRIPVSVAQGNFWTLTVQHASSGAGDPAFTGSMTFQLFADLTPETVAKIEQLIQTGFYTSPTQPTSGTPLPHKNFHRIVPGFVAQGGSRTGDGAGSVNVPGYPFPDEFNAQLVFNGKYQLAMAKSNDDTNDSQFFITYGQPRFLDFQHTIFGQLVSGQEIADLMEQVARTPNTETPVNPILITGSSLAATNPDGVLHIDATAATPGETATVTVTAFDPSDSSQVTRTFTVTVTENVDANGRPIVQNPFLQPNPTNLVVATNQPAIFQLQAVSVGNRPLAYTVQGGISPGGTFVPVQNATATVDANGVVTVTPNTNFTGVINLVVGVKNASTTGNTPADFDTEAITLTVRDGAVVNLPPIAVPGSTTVPANEPSTIQLTGLTANPQQTTQTLTYQIVAGPSQGTITSFNPQSGTLVYTPRPDFQGTDTIQFRVSDQGDPGPSLTSQTATFTITVGGRDTGAVRVIDRVLVVTPPPRRGHGRVNEIVVEPVGDTVRVTINGVFDQTTPRIADLDRIVVYGSKASDRIRISPELDLPATLNGGRGGRNLLRAGSGKTRLHGWYGENILRGGPNNDRLFGRAGHVRVVPSKGDDVAFAGQTALLKRPGRTDSVTSTYPPRPTPPTGRFFRFANRRPYAIPTPGPVFFRTNVARVAQGHAPVVQVGEPAG
jgi:cyclophilin family peptidyl-prolyl cis-trans isomerase